MIASEYGCVCVGRGINKNVLKFKSGDGCTTVNILKTLNCTLLKSDFFGM